MLVRRRSFLDSFSTGKMHFSGTSTIFLWIRRYFRSLMGGVLYTVGAASCSNFYIINVNYIMNTI